MGEIFLREEKVRYVYNPGPDQPLLYTTQHVWCCGRGAELFIETDKTSVIGELAALGSRQLGPPEGGMTYEAVFAGSINAYQRSGSRTPTAMDSDPSEAAVSTETANRRTSSDMSGSLGGTPVGSTPNAQVANTCVPAEHRPNKTLIFNSGFRDTRAFLAWLRASYRGGLTAEQ